jgi:hypothetical protein
MREIRLEFENHDPGEYFERYWLESKCTRHDISTGLEERVDELIFYALSGFVEHVYRTLHTWTGRVIDESDVRSRASGTGPY